MYSGVSLATTRTTLHRELAKGELSRVRPTDDAEPTKGRPRKIWAVVDPGGVEEELDRFSSLVDAGPKPPKSGPQQPMSTSSKEADHRGSQPLVSELDEIWARYREVATQADRDQLIVYYAPLVRFVADRVAAGLPKSFDRADLLSVGIFGLIDAITKFDPKRGFKFETYAISRVKGAMLDELRSIDRAPDSVRANAKSVNHVMPNLELTIQGAPTDEEVADEIGITVGQLNGIYNQIG